MTITIDQSWLERHAGEDDYLEIGAGSFSMDLLAPPPTDHPTGTALLKAGDS